MEPRMHLDPVTRWVRELTDDEWYLPREAAEMLGISVERIKALGRRFPEELGPGAVGWMGDVKIFLYRAADIDALRTFFSTPKPRVSGVDPFRGGMGRPPMWTNAEHADRHRRRALAYYHRRAAAGYAEQGRTEKAEQAKAREAGILAGLRAQLAERREQLKP